VLGGLDIAFTTVLLGTQLAINVVVLVVGLPGLAARPRRHVVGAVVEVYGRCPNLVSDEACCVGVFVVMMG
jgi:hypothetical protein